MILKVTQGHRSCLYLIVHSHFLVTTTPSGTVSEILPHLQCTWLPVNWRSPSFTKR